MYFIELLNYYHYYYSKNKWESWKIMGVDTSYFQHWKVWMVVVNGGEAGWLSRRGRKN